MPNNVYQSGLINQANHEQPLYQSNREQLLFQTGNEQLNSSTRGQSRYVPQAPPSSVIRGGGGGTGHSTQREMAHHMPHPTMSSQYAR
jgi:hypothetical protein